MLFYFLIHLIRSAAYLNITPTNFDRIAHDPIPLIVRFHTLHRKYSLQLDEQFDLVHEMYDGVDGINVGSVNCGKFRTLCYREGVSMSPHVRLYMNHLYYDYEGGMSHESISRWATGKTGVHSKELHYALRQPNGRVFKEILNETHCTFVMFYSPWSVPSKKFLVHMKQVAEAFRYDDRVAIVANDIDLYKFFNWDYTLHDYPDLQLFIKDVADPIKYEAKRNAEELIDFINDHCGTQRGLNGRLNSDAGVIEQVSNIVEDFLTKGKKASYISEMEQTEGTEYYVYVMKEILAKGEQFVEQERNRLNSLLDEGNLSPDKIDNFQVRVNILSQFIYLLSDLS